MKSFIKNNPFISIAIICSVSLCVIHFFLFIYLLPLENNFPRFLSGLNILVPNIIVILMLNIIFVMIKNKWQLVIKILSAIVNTGLIFVQLYMCLGVYAYNYIMTNPAYDYKQSFISDSTSYIEAKKSISCLKCIRHFPKVIPETARNVEFYKYINWFGAEGIFLGYDIDKDYIEKSISKQNCKYYSLPNDNLQSREMHTMGVIEFDEGFMNADGYTFCVLNPLKTRKTSFIPQYGIAFRQNHIIYYYNKKD